MNDRHAGRPAHRLFWINGPQKLASFAYEPGARRPAGAFNIRSVMRGNPALREFLDAWSRPLESELGVPSVVDVRRLFHRVAQGQALTPLQLRLAAFNAIRLGVFGWIGVMRAHFRKFSPALTASYRELVERLPMPESRWDELLFHCARPDFYLWQPDAVTRGPLLVCFTTRSASLNMPLPLAHVLLGRLGVPIMYVLNRPEFLVSQGLKGVGEEATLAVIRHVMGKSGCSEAVALGASFGGYQACVYAERLGFRRILNYSGLSAADRPGRELWNLAAGLEADSVLSVFDSGDAVDRKLVEEYRSHAVPTRIEMLAQGRHGTFTGAFLASRLDVHLRWLLGRHHAR